MRPSPTQQLLAPLGAHHHVLGFGTLQLYRIYQEIQWTRKQPAPGNNVLDEVLRLAGAASALQPFDAQRVYELLGARSGDGVAMVFADGQAKIAGRAIDLVLRMLARPDQALHCAARCGDLMQELVRFVYADPAWVGVEQQHQAALARAIAAVGGGPVTSELMRVVPEYGRGELAAHAKQALGRPWCESFGPAGAAFAGPAWQDPFDDEGLRDGRDPKTTRTGHVEGW